jgi:hypothetical protein
MAANKPTAKLLTAIRPVPAGDQGIHALDARI